MMTKPLAFLLWVLCIIGALAALPYLLFLNSSLLAGSYPRFLLISILQAVILYGVVVVLSYFLTKHVDLRPFDPKRKWKTILQYGLISGVGVGLVIFALDKLFFKHSALSKMHPPSWTGLCSALYGGINEEVLMRLFFVTLIYFLLAKVLKKGKNRTLHIWSAIIVATIAFGLGHLGVAYKLQHTSHFEVVRILILNGIAGIVFGWLYCYVGFWSAASAHFTADILLHSLLI